MMLNSLLSVPKKLFEDIIIKNKLIKKTNIILNLEKYNTSQNN